MEDAHIEAIQPTLQEKKVDNVSSYEHYHWVELKGIGSGYTSAALGAGKNHTHKLPNGLETGPAIDLFGGGHIHQATTEEYTGPAVATEVANEIEAIRQESRLDQPQDVEVEYDTKTGKFTAKDVGERALQTIIASKEEFSSETEAHKAAMKFDDSLKTEATESSFRFRVREPGEFREGSFKSFKPRGMKGITLVFGEVK